MIKLEHVSKAYAAGIPALNDVNLEIEDGEFVFVVGDSGSGKSTLIKLLLKELEPTEGTILVDGKKLGSVKHKQIPKYRRNIGVVFQDFRLLKDRNVYDNVAFAQKLVGETNSHIRKKVPMMLSMVGLAAKYRSFPKQLSGGEQQRVAIARALINEPDILLADEPTGNLDNNNAWEIMKLLEEINNKATTVLVVTHNLEIVKVMKKRVITVKKGTIVSDSKQGDDYDEDYYDDYEDDDMDLEPEKPEKKERVTKSRSERFSARRAATRNDDNIIDDYDEVTAEHEEEPAPHVKTRATARAVKNSRSSRNHKVVPMKSSSEMEVCVIKPSYYENTRDIIDTLLEGKSVVLNLEGMKLDLAQRIVDSVSGGCYAIQGNLQKISGYIYLVTPHSVDITGDFQDLVHDSSDYSSTAYSRRNY